MRSDWEAGNAKHDPADPMGTEDGKTWVEAGRQPNRGDTSGAAGGPSLAWPSVGCKIVILSRIACCPSR